MFFVTFHLVLVICNLIMVTFHLDLSDIANKIINECSFSHNMIK